MSFVNLTGQLEGLTARGGLMRLPLEALSDIADAIPTTPVSGYGQLPDVWSHVSVFQTAFADPSHPSHEEAVGQWRGLIALFALAGQFKDSYSLSVSSIAHQDGAADGALADALAGAPELTLMPDVRLSEAAPVITLTLSHPKAAHNPRHVVGLAAPTSLLAPAISARHIPPGVLPFLDHGLLDPLSESVRGRMRGAYWKIIGAYSRSLAEAAAPLTRMEGRSPIWTNAAHALWRQLSEFSEQCAAAALTDATVERVQLEPRAWPADALLRQLDITYVAELGSASCDARLNPDAPDGQGLAVHLADPSLVDTLNRTAADVVVWEQASLQDVLDADTFTLVRDQALAQDALLLRPSDLFTDEALRMERTEAAAHGAGARRWVLPLTPAALLALGGRDVASRIHVQEGTSPGHGQFARITLRLPISAGVEHEVTRLYAEYPQAAPEDAGLLLKLEGEDEYNAPDVFAVWPDFQSQDWLHNFLYFRANPMADLAPAAGLSADLIAADVFASTDINERRAALRRWTTPNGADLLTHYLSEPVSQIANDGEPHAPWLERLRFTEDNQEVGEVQRLRSLQAVAMTRPDAGQGRRLAGLILVDRPEAPDLAETKDVAAIDFGTTGTVAQLSVDGAYHDVALKNRLHYVTNDPEQAEPPAVRTPEAFAGFFPHEDAESPIATVAYTRPLHGPAADLAAGAFGFDELGFTHTAYFERDLGRVLSATEAGLLTYGLKWGAGKRPVAKRFLRQLILMIAAEAAANGRRADTMGWCFSFPESFTSVERSSFRRVAVQAALDEIFGEGRVEPSLYSESMALIEHFTDKNFAETQDDSNPILALDIGGGSSDAVLWSRGRLIWRNSFPIGGQDFFTEIVRRHPRFLQDIVPQEPSVAALCNLMSRGADGPDAERALGLVEAVLASESFQKRFEKNFPLMWDEGAALALRVCATSMLGGVLWYVGRVLKGLVDQEKIGRKSLDRLTLVLGGRGSRLFRLLHDERSDASHLTELCAMLLYGAETDSVEFDPARIHLTKRVKREVALGMLHYVQSGRAEPGAEVATPRQAHHMPLLSNVRISRGDDVSVLTGEEDVRALMQGGSLRMGTAVDVDAGDDFQDFMAALGASGGARLSFTESGYGEWMAEVQARTHQEIADAPPRAADQSIHYIESPFITGLRVLIEWLADPEQRDARLTLRPS